MTTTPSPAVLPQGSELAVRARGVRKTYRARTGTPVTAVGGVDLDVARGEILALLGPNGAGKTTTTEILEGFRRRDAGEVEVLGEEPWRASRAWRSRVGIVLQDSDRQAHADLTVTELVSHFTTLFPDAREAGELIDRVGLAEKRRTRVGSLSGGQHRRLDVALGIVGRPELLFLDEPTTGFDPAARRQFWTLVESLRDEGTTILLTTHYLDEAERLADRVAVISAGRVVSCAPPATLGGELRSQALVRWTDAAGQQRSVTTATPTAVVSELAGDTAPVPEVPDLEVRRLSLEDVYLSLIGNGEATAGQVVDTADGDGWGR